MTDTERKELLGQAISEHFPNTPLHEIEGVIFRVGYLAEAELKGGTIATGRLVT